MLVCGVREVRRDDSYLEHSQPKHVHDIRIIISPVSNWSLMKWMVLYSIMEFAELDMEVL